MVFSSIEFLFFFLPLVVGLFYIIPKKIKFWFLLFMSLWFYAWGEPKAFWIIILSTVVDYFCALKIEFYRNNNSSKLGPKLFLLLSIITNLALLGYFKYANFFVENILTLGFDTTSFEFLSEIALPLGISFYTFQSMSYTIDVYWGEVKATNDFSKFAGYVTLFPQLVAGPIVRYRDIEKQLEAHSINLEDAYRGTIRFVLGLGKKVLIANTCGRIADEIFLISGDNLTTSLAWIGIIAYTFQIYFDFSGYSDMAIGLGRVFGFRFLENFNYPYVSQSITEFWRRWHISLSTWWKDYVYIPLGGNRVSKVKNLRNLFLVFFLCGLWHGASWNFAFWGVYHGSLLVLEKTPIRKLTYQLPPIFKHIYTMLLVMIGWVFFRAETLSDSLHFLKSMFGFNSISSNDIVLFPSSYYLRAEEVITLLAATLLSTPFYPVLKRKLQGKLLNTNIIEPIYSIIILILSITYLAASTYNPFIYFRF